MPEKQFTLFNLDFENAEFQFGPKSLPGESGLKNRLMPGDSDGASADGSDDAAEDVDLAETDDGEETDGDDGSSRLGDLFRFALIGLLAIVAQRLLADEDDEDDSQLANVTDLGIVGRGDTDDESSDEADESTDAESEGDDDAVSIEVEDGDADGASSGGRSMTTSLLLLGVLVGVAFVAKKFLGGDELEALDELDDVTAEP